MKDHVGTAWFRLLFVPNALLEVHVPQKDVSEIGIRRQDAPVLGPRLEAVYLAGMHQNLGDLKLRLLLSPLSTILLLTQVPRKRRRDPCLILEAFDLSQLVSSLCKIDLSYS